MSLKFIERQGFFQLAHDYYGSATDRFSSKLFHFNCWAGLVFRRTKVTERIKIICEKDKLLKLTCIQLDSFLSFRYLSN